MNLKRLKAGSLVVFMGQGFMGGSGLLIYMLLSRLITPSELGLYILLMQVVNVSRLFSEAGMHVGMQKLIGVDLADKAWGKVKAHSQAVFTLIFLSSFLVCLALYAGWGTIAGPIFNKPDLLPFIFVTMVWLVGRGIEDLGNVFFRSLGEIPKAVLGCGVPRQFLLLSLLGGAYFVLGQLAFPQLLTVVSATWVFGAALALVLVFWRLSQIKTPVSIDFPQAAKEVAGISFPMLLHGGAAVVLTSADLWVLGAMESSETVGIYGVVSRMAGGMALILSVVGMVLPPMLAGLYREKNLKQMENLLRRSALWGFYLALPLALLFLLFGEDILTLAFGEVYGVGHLALALLAVAHMFNTFAGTPGYVLQMTGGHVTLMRLTIGVAIFNLIGNVLVVGPYGMAGVAAVTAGSLAVQNTTMMFLVWRRLGIKTWIKAPWN